MPRWVDIRRDAVMRGVSDEAHAAGERMLELFALVGESNSFAFQGEVSAAWAKARAAREISLAMGRFHEDTIQIVSALAALAAGDAAAAKAACESAMRLKPLLNERFTREPSLR